MKRSVVIMMFLVAAFYTVAWGGWGGVAHVSAASSAGVMDDTGGQQGVTWLESLSRSSWAKMVFGAALLVSIFCILFTKHKGYAITVFVFLICLGAYSGLLETLWQWVGTWNSSSTASTGP